MPYFFIFFILFSHSVLAQESLEPIVVEGQGKLGASVIVIKKEELKSNTPFVLDLIKKASGLNVFSNGGPGQPSSVLIRGSKSEHVLVLIDGVEMNNPSSPARAFDFSNLNTDNIETIEIYKGAASSIFGSDALGGVINIRTKSGKSKSRSLHFEGGSFLTHRINYQDSGSLLYFDYFLSGTHHKSQAFSAAGAPNPKDDDGFENINLNLKLEKDFNNSTSLNFISTYNQYKTDLDYAGGVDDPNYRSDQQQILLGSNFKTNFLNQRLKLNLNLSHLFAFREFNNPSDQLNTDNYHEDFDAQNMKIENKLSYQLNSYSLVEFNLYFRNENASSKTNFNGTVSPKSNNNQSIYAQSAFYKSKFNFFTFLIGLRHDRFSYLNKSFLNQSASVEYDWKTLASKISFNYSSGIKTPSLFQLYSDFGSSDLHAEEAQSYDLSFEKVFLKNNSLTLTYFDNNFRNLIDFNTTTSKYQNITSARISGLEVGLSQLFFEILTAEISYSFLHAKDLTHHLDLLRRPKDSFKGALSGVFYNYFLELNFEFIGQRPDIDPINFQRITQGSYLVFNLLGRYELKNNLHLNWRLDNLLDKQYQQIAGYQTSGRALYLGARYYF